MKIITYICDIYTYFGNQNLNSTTAIIMYDFLRQILFLCNFSIFSLKISPKTDFLAWLLLHNMSVGIFKF